jgi:hypothetical protein
MSPPLIDTEKPKKPCSEKQRIANAANAKRSRGPGPEAKLRTRFNACKHNLRAESPVLPGEDGDELMRRLAVWPVEAGAETELEWFFATRAVHAGWRLARADRSEDAAAEREMIAVEQRFHDAQESEALVLVQELDSDTDPAGVIRKMHRTPAACRALLNEWTCLQIRSDTYATLFWSQRERLFHILGKRLRDLFKDDPVITTWIVALMGAVYGDAEGDKAEKIGQVLEGLRPAWMGQNEFRLRMTVLGGMLKSKAAATAKVRRLVGAAIADLKCRLKQAVARAEYVLMLELERAAVSDTPEGARRLNYKLGHGRALDAAVRRMKDLQKWRWAGGETIADEPEGESETDGASASATAPSPVDETAAGSPVSEEPVSAGPITPGGINPVPMPGGSADDVPITNDPICGRDGPITPAGNEPTSVPAGGRDDVPITNDPIFALAGPGGEFLSAAPAMGLATATPCQWAGKSPPDRWPP